MRVLRGPVARELAALEARMERAFERAFDVGLGAPQGRVGPGDSFRPAVDVYETEHATVVRVELAGVRSEDVRLTVDGEYLQIAGRRFASPGDAPAAHLQMEIPHGSFERVMRLRTPYDAERVVAKLEAGLLVVELPRREPRARSIPVTREVEETR